MGTLVILNSAEVGTEVLRKFTEVRILIHRSATSHLSGTVFLEEVGVDDVDIVHGFTILRVICISPRSHFKLSGT